MNFSKEWKSCLPISLSYESPLLIYGSSAKDIFGPLVFKPEPETLTHVFSSTSMLPPAPSFPRLSFPRFLATSSCSSSVLPSTSSSVASLFHVENYGEITSASPYNCLVSIECPNRKGVIVFFPTGVNSEQVGFFVLYVKGSNWHVQLDDNGDIFKSGSGFYYRILRISVNPIAHVSFGSSTSARALSCTIGYLLASTMYSIHWFRIKVNKSYSGSERPNLVYIGCKIFKTCSIVHACWSQHIPEESVVLLENGDLFLFDLGSNMKTCNSNRHFKGKKLVVPWNDSINSSKNTWFSCEFSWHPRILIVARSDAVFLVDCRLDQCNVSYLAKVDMLHTYVSSKEQFLAFSKASSDGFYFALATGHLLLLCDVRKPMMPILQWVHALERPCYMDVLSLSSLRSHTKDDKYKMASDSGFCILLGSFWNCEFNLFCYGPSLSTVRGSVAHWPSKTCETFFAWGLPSEISLSRHECHCGSCLLREEFSKNVLPEWIEWQHKKEIILGFGIIDSHISSLLYEPLEFGGFTLVRLLSSGKLELQRYYASSTSERKSDGCPHNRLLHSDNHFLYSLADDQYKFPRRFNYLKLDYLHAYLNGKLTQLLLSELEKPRKSPGKESFSAEAHQILCEKLSACGLGRKISLPPVSVVFGDVSLPSSIHEVALRRLWADLPLELLQLAFSNYSELLEVVVDKKSLALEFLVVTDLPQLPPFFLRKPSPRSNKWSQNVQPSEEIVGPVLPLPILHELNEIHNGGSNVNKSRLSVMAELNHKCEEIMQVADEISVSGSACEFHVVSLASDLEEMKVGSQKPKPYLRYHPQAFEHSIEDPIQQWNTISKDRVFDTLICHIPGKKPVSNSDTESIDQEIDDLCPIQLKFDVPVHEIGAEGLKSFKYLTRQLSRWQKHFDIYQEFCVQSKLQT